MKWEVSIGILKLSEIHELGDQMSLRIMLVIGAVVLLMVAAAFFGRPDQPAPQPSTKPIGNSAVSHGGSRDAGR